MAKGGRSKDIVALVALLCAASYGTWLWMRSSMELGGGWTDGENVWNTVRGEKIRYAVWDDAEPLPGLEREVASRPALSPDERWLVFAIGERGLNTDLYISELVSGRPTEPYPLSVLNGPSDELAPAFIHDALYFATDRNGTGDLDLWRSTYVDGSFAPPEPLPRGVNTEADETDPWPIAGGSVAFASDRPRGNRRDFELYRADPTPEGSEFPMKVERLDTLSTPFDERDPSLSADGRTLVFASDRAGGRGGFDLYRSVLEDERWLSPDPLHGVNGRHSERGPLLSRDGFTLFFDRTEAPEIGPGLWRSNSIELFRVPGPPVGWREFAILGALVLLALLAWLAKRWTAMEIIYKCFLISLIAHLILLYFLREVYPESTPVELPGEDRAIRVRLAPSLETVPANSQERSGELQAMRNEEFLEATPEKRATELAQAELANAGPSMQASMQAPSAPSPQAPAPSAPALEARAEAQVETRLENRETFERQSGAAPSLVVASRPTEARPEQSSEARPVRRVSETGRLITEATPSVQTALSQPEVPDSLQSTPSTSRLERDSVPAPEVASVTIAAPAETFAPLTPAAPAPSLALPEVAIVTPDATTIGDGGQEATPTRRESPTPEWTGTNTVEVAQRAPTIAALESPSYTPPTRPQSRFDTALRSPERVNLDVRAVKPDTTAPTAQTSQDGPKRFDALAGLQTQGPAPYARPLDSAPTGPTRLSEPRPSEPLAALTPALRGQPLALPKAPEPPDKDDAPSKLEIEETPYKNRFGNEKLRALEEYGGSDETEEAVSAGLAYLASVQSDRGYWGSRRDYHDKYGDVRIGKTGLALLAFLGAGHTPRSGAKYAYVSERAVDFLLSQLDINSWHFGDSASYGHGIATYALAECYALTKDPVLERPLRGAIDHILENQQQRDDPRFKGGWGYYYNDGRVWSSDRWPRVSVTSWQVMALESARLGGLSVPKEAFDSARDFLLSAWDDRRDAFRYSHDPARMRSGYPILPASTPAALFALSLLNRDPGGREFAEARRFVLSRIPKSYEFYDEDEFVFQAQGNLYFWYYGSLAMFRSGGGSWRRWNQAMKEILLPAQETDGSWKNISIYARYAGDDGGDRSYSTAMCVLTLEVYYRYFTPLLDTR